MGPAYAIKAAMRWQLCLVAFGVVAACSRQPDDLREWRPSDHDHTDSPNSGQVSSAPDSGRPVSPAAMMGLDEVVLATWKSKCVACHGLIGRGDGPRGSMLKVRNLADPQWQASVSDADIAATIKTGRGAMPGFELPDTTVSGLVRLVRMIGGAASDAGAPLEGGAGEGGAVDAGAPRASAAPQAPHPPNAPSAAVP